MSLTGSQINSDKRLLRFRRYEDYLDSLITFVDLGYLGNLIVARKLTELGYSCTGETLDEKTFYSRLRSVKDWLFPLHRPYELTSQFVTPANAVMRELALRERANRLRIISTIIFVRSFTKLRFEISGYIDFCERIEKEDWLPYFEGKKKIRPVASDLAYYHWRAGKTCLNESRNFQPVIDPRLGLRFKNCHDRQTVNIDPTASVAGVDTTRVRVFCPEYEEHVVLYDHIIQTKV